jgi:hypothetical protein
MKFKHLLAYKRKYIQFSKSFVEFKKKSDGRFKVDWDDINPKIYEATKKHSYDPHYIYHTAWAARILAITKPQLHTDISSALYFGSITSAFIPMQFYDYRKLDLKLSNLSVGSADLTSLQFQSDSVKSLSCMHTIEHIGLGRYGEPLDPDGDLRAIEELKRVLAPNGDLLFVVPIGLQKIYFNAHRVYSVKSIKNYFKGFKLKEFSLVTDNGRFIKNAAPKLGDLQEYGCGCFWFKK